jgi:hypothetical protein
MTQVTSLRSHLLDALSVPVHASCSFWEVSAVRKLVASLKLTDALDADRAQ